MLSIFPVPESMPVRVAPTSPPVPTTDRNKIVAGGRGSGIVTPILTITLVGVLATAPWALIDTIRLLVMSDRAFARRIEPSVAV